MANFTLEEVATDKQKREFLTMAKRIYEGNRNWVHPLDSDIESRFDPECNKLLANGEAVRWIVRDDTGAVVGRIAAFYNRDQAKIEEQPTGGCGFFESIDNREVANMLFDASRNWLAQRGMEAMDGPVNFGARDEWWGCLVAGFEIQPLYANPYNLPYYKDLFENYGFQNYFNQYTHLRMIQVGELNESIYARVKRLEATPGYRFSYINKRDLVQIAEDFRRVYNKAWSSIPGVNPMTHEEAQDVMGKLKPIIDEKLIYFAYFNDEPIGFFIMVPDINRIIGSLNGKLNFINKIRFMFMLKYSKKVDRIFGITFGVTPEFQGRGVEAGMINAFESAVAKGEIDPKYKTLELAWVGDFNPVMMRVTENYVRARKLKTHVTYRYLFDRTKEFKRCPRMSLKRPEGNL